jgi:predicted flap endonuclease-1-like 5' DNA nuclease
MTTKVAFKLPATHVAGAEEGILLGEFNEWNTAEGIYLQKQEDGSMIAELSLTAGKSYQYRYLLSDGRWVNDENAKTFSDVFGHAVENCIIDVPVPEKKAKAKKETKKETIKPVAEKKSKPVVENVADDLTKIEGIGKKVAALLQENGITQFKALGKLSIKKLQLILDDAGSKFTLHDPSTWPKQAKLAADQKWDELKTLQEELSGGKFKA